MQRHELNFSYPEELVATEPHPSFRIAHWGRQPVELTKAQLFELFAPGDLLVINNTQVEPRRVFAGDNEILFLRALSDLDWEVLFPAREFTPGQTWTLPGGVEATLLAKGLPQQIRLSEAVGAKYFSQFGEPALPPYIQRARGQRRARPQDHQWYQSAWAEVPGSSAAPTASLHFSRQDLATLRRRGVLIVPITLHVGLGTFLPIKSENLADHQMHAESVTLTAAAQESLTRCQGRVWALGTTALRAVEAWAQGDLKEQESGDWAGETRLFIQQGYEFKKVSGLLTNFHQPESTLLALVMAFAGPEPTRQLYQWAIARRFRLFSYGDLSVWTR